MEKGTANPMGRPSKEQEYMNQEIRNTLGDPVMAIVSLRVKLRINEERIKELEASINVKEVKNG